MEWISIVITFLLGICVGFAGAYFLKVFRMKTGRELAGEIFADAETMRKEERENFLNSMKASFGDISHDAMKNNADQVIRITEGKFKTERELHSKELETKKILIDEHLNRITQQLDHMSSFVGELEKDREKKFGSLSKHLEEAGKRTSELLSTTKVLSEALAHSKTRGQWGERMAEDVLRMAGFVENINYVKQKAAGDTRNIPDFTFMLPRELMLNMDVKFSLDNYMRYLDAGDVSSSDMYRKNFLRDVRSRIKEVTTRDYINPEQNTVDYVLLFIPNEQIYSFIHEQDSDIMDEGLKKRVIICSPLTLFAVLAVIRAAVDNFALEKTSNRMLTLIGTFRVQWEKFKDSLKNVGKRIEATHKEYDGLMGTRFRALEKPVNEIEEIRKQRGLPLGNENDDVQLLEDSDENHD